MLSCAFAFSGAIGSGKTTLSLALSEKISCSYASFGGYIRMLAMDNGYKDPSREQLQQIGEYLVNTDTVNFCEAVLHSAGWQKGENLVIDGVRHLEVLRTLHRILIPQRLVLIYVEVEDHKRVERIKSRGLEIISSLDSKHSTEVQVPAKLKNIADLIVDSSDPVESNIELIITTFLSN